MPIDRQFVITQQGKDYVLYGGLLDEAHRQGLKDIETTLAQVPGPENGHVAIVTATVRLLSPEGVQKTFTGIGDADQGNVNRMMAKALIRMAECSRLSSAILTRSGWKLHDQLQLGEDVLAYDVSSDTCRWVPLQAITVYGEDDPKPIIRLVSRSFEAHVTPEHTWPVRYGGRRVFAPQRGMRKSTALTKADHIILAAPAEGGTHPLSPRDAAVLGWLATDGSVSTRYLGGTGYVTAVIHQSKSRYVDELRALLGDDASEQVQKAGSSAFPRGISATLPAHRFRLHAHYQRRLFAIAGFRDWGDLVPLATQLSQSARAAMLDAMLKGDGTQNKYGRWAFGKRMHPGVMEAFEVLATLEGHALGSPQISSVGNVPVRTIRRNRYANAGYLRHEELPAEPVWCPTTECGTWIMRDASGTVSITGNTRAKARALRDAINVAGDLLDDLPDAGTPAGDVPDKPAPKAPTAAAMTPSPARSSSAPAPAAATPTAPTPAANAVEAHPVNPPPDTIRSAITARAELAQADERLSLALGYRARPDPGSEEQLRKHLANLLRAAELNHVPLELTCELADIPPSQLPPTILSVETAIKQALADRLPGQIQPAVPPKAKVAAG